MNNQIEIQKRESDKTGVNEHENLSQNIDH